MEISLPRLARISSADIFNKSRPENNISPLTILPLAEMSRIIERASIVLPQPDSPTIPRVSPELIFNETPSTALILPRAVSNAVIKSFISRSSGIFSIFGHDCAEIPRAIEQRLPMRLSEYKFFLYLSKQGRQCPDAPRAHLRQICLKTL